MVTKYGIQAKKRKSQKKSQATKEIPQMFGSQFIIRIRKTRVSIAITMFLSGFKQEQWKF